MSERPDRPARVATSDPKDLPHEMWPLDWVILKTLPHEGQMLGGVHYMGRRVKDIADELGEHVTSAQVNTRMRICKLNGLTVDRPATGGRVWQRTEKAEVLLRERGDLPPEGGSDPEPELPAAA